MKKLLFFAFSLILYSNFAFTQSAKLDLQELKVMKETWGKLGLAGKKEFDFEKDPCSSNRRWTRFVRCDCSFESNSTCHVTKISLRGNQLSGPFPIALTRITTLKYLNIEGNQFSGPIPKEIANLQNLETLDLSSNRFTGQLPVAVAKLTMLINLHIHGCSFEGPIPSEISKLTQLKDLRISDLKGGASTFPSLENMTKLNILVLRNCLIHGSIPNYFGRMKHLSTLDLSFNSLTGEIPSCFSKQEISHMYLTKNNLTGHMPGWVSSTTKYVDLSYNYFTWDASGPTTCELGIANVVESYSSSTNKQNNIHPCLMKGFPCTKPIKQLINSLHINCGGDEVIINDTIKYEADNDIHGDSMYYNGGNWAFSSTGSFLDDGHESDIFLTSNSSILHKISSFDVELYTNARKAAISLTYYGLCLMNGNYTVRLHFAEIVLSLYNSSNIIGKRVFDVYVQGELKLKDFDIVKAAGGTGMAVIKSFIVDVKKHTLMIQLYWAGKGTINIPFKGAYGPIISAISVNANFETPHFGKTMDVGIIVGIVGGMFLVFLISFTLWRRGYVMSKTQHIETDLMSHTTSFS